MKMKVLVGFEESQTEHNVSEVNVVASSKLLQNLIKSTTL